MSQQIVSRLLLIAYIASQLAAIPHAHAESCCVEHSDHSARPHIHLPGFSHQHHTHHENEHHHEHPHSDEWCDADSPCPSHPPAGHLADCDDHDCNTVYLSYDLGSPSSLNKQGVSPAELSFLTWVTDPLIILSSRGPALARVGEFNDVCSFDCPLYLALRTLLI